MFSAQSLNWLNQSLGLSRRTERPCPRDSRVKWTSPSSGLTEPYIDPSLPTTTLPSPQKCHIIRTLHSIIYGEKFYVEKISVEKNDKYEVCIYHIKCYICGRPVLADDQVALTSKMLYHTLHYILSYIIYMIKPRCPHVPPSSRAKARETPPLGVTLE